MYMVHVFECANRMMEIASFSIFQNLLQKTFESFRIWKLNNSPDLTPL